jgi:hypothetical protein
MTNSIEQSPSWDTDSCSASQEIPCVFWNRRLNAVTTAHAFLFNFFKIDINIIFLSMSSSSKLSSLQVSPPTTCMHISFSPYIVRMFVSDYNDWGFAVLFPQLLGKCQGKTSKDGARPALFLIFVLFYVFLCCSMYCLFCIVLCIVCVYMCTVLLPPGGYPIAVKYIISYQILRYFIIKIIVVDEGYRSRISSVCSTV